MFVGLEINTRMMNTCTDVLDIYIWYIWLIELFRSYKTELQSLYNYYNPDILQYIQSKFMFTTGIFKISYKKGLLTLFRPLLK